MKRTLIIALSVIMMISYVDVFAEEIIYYNSWTSIANEMICFDNSVYCIGKRNGVTRMVNIYVIENNKAVLLTRKRGVYGLSVYEDKLFMEITQTGLIGHLLHSSWIKHSGILFDPQTKKSKTVIAPVEYFDVPLIKYIVRSNRIFSIEKQENGADKQFCLYILNGNEKTYLFDLENMYSCFYPTFCCQHGITKEAEKKRKKGIPVEISFDFFDYKDCTVYSTRPLSITLNSSGLQAVLIQHELYYLADDGIHIYDLDTEEDTVLLFLPEHSYSNFSLSGDTIVLYIQKTALQEPAEYRADFYSIPDGKMIDTILLEKNFNSVVVDQNRLYTFNRPIIECIDRTTHEKTYIDID